MQFIQNQKQFRLEGKTDMTIEHCESILLENCSKIILFDCKLVRLNKCGSIMLLDCDQVCAQKCHDVNFARKEKKVPQVEEVSANVPMDLVGNSVR
jgi:hypothetical protein